MRCFSIVGLALLCLTSPDASAVVFSCADDKLEPVVWVRKHLDQADAVFLGEVLSAKAVYLGKDLSAEVPDRADLNAPESPQVGSLKELIDFIESADYAKHLYDTASIEVIKSWKGTTAHIITAKTPSVRIFGPFVVGETYLIFGYKSDGKILSVSADCGEMKRAKKSVDRIALLDELT